MWANICHGQHLTSSMMARSSPMALADLELCSCEEPFSLCFIKPPNVMCGGAGDLPRCLHPSAFWSPSTKTACQWRFGLLGAHPLEQECI